MFVKELFKVWLEEWLHMIYRWERADNYAFMDEEKIVRTWVELLSRRD